MKRNIFTVMLAVVSTLCCAFLLFACGGLTSEGSDAHECRFTNYVYNHDATCTHDGTETAVCEYQNCYLSDIRTKPNTATGHYFESYLYNDDATCVTDGTETAKCKRCDERDTRIKIDSKTGIHSYIDYTYNNDATCIENGTETAKCENCDEINIRTKPYTATGIHKYTNYIYNNDANCGKDGTETAKCDNCDMRDKRTAVNTATARHSYEDMICKICYDIDLNAPITESLEYEEIVENGEIIGYSVTKWNDDNYKYIKIPSTYNEKPVISIGNFAFQNCSNVIAVQVPNSIMNIGQRSFAGCSKIKSINIPNNLTHIGYRAFSDCSSLTSIEIPNGVTTIVGEAFYGCKSLTIYCEAVAKPSGWNVMWNGSQPVVWDCKNNFKTQENAEYAIIDGLRYCLKGNTATLVKQPTDIKGDIIIPESVAFDGITYDVAPNINYSVFSGCNYITSIQISDVITDIGDYAFSDCGKLKSIEIPDSVTVIGRNAFMNCSSLTNIIIPNSVDDIGKAVFYGCTMLTSVTLSSQTKILEGYYDSNDKKAYGFFGSCRNLKSIELPSKVYNIGNYAFDGCSSLTSIIISDSVSNIGGRAFRDCNSLTIYCEVDSKQRYWNDSWNDSSCPVVWNCGKNDKDDDGFAYILVDGLRYRLKDGMAVLISQPSCLNGDITIPQNVLYDDESYMVKEISDNSFTGLGITQIHISDGVESIGNNAFKSCAELSSILFDNDSALSNIGSSAFHNCASIASISIPKSVKTIGNSVFENCTELSSILFDNDSVLTSIGARVFYNCTSIKSISIPKSVTYAGSDAFGRCEIIEAVAPWAAMSKIADDNNLQTAEVNGGEALNSTFYNMDSLVTLTIHARRIGQQAFAKCANLTSVIIGVEVIGIDGSAFGGCPEIVNLAVESGNPKYHSDGNCIIETATKTLVIGCKTSIIPSDGSVTVIGRAHISMECGAFMGCKGLTEITIPNSITNIDDYAFKGCELSGIISPNSVSRIGFSAFQSCANLTNVIIYNGVSNIESMAFQSCFALKEIRYMGTKSQWGTIKKSNYWAYGVSGKCPYKINCSDGTINNSV